MRRAKAEYALSTRPRAFPTAEECAAEMSVSTATWLRWVADGDAPPPVPGSPERAPRWRWVDVDEWFTSPLARPMILGRYAGAGFAAGPAPVTVADPFLANVGKMLDGPPSRKRRGRAAV